VQNISKENRVLQSSLRKQDRDMGDVNLKWIVLIVVVVYFCVLCTEGASFTDTNGTKPGELNGKKLRELGMKLKLPKLRMIGKAIENMEIKIESGIEKLENETARKICDLNHCLPWTDWSKCSSNIHLFGSKFRTRQCSIDVTTCKVDTFNSKTEKEFGICGGFCPESYNITKNGFCLKLFSDKLRNMAEAELQCQEDSGHLINIDSEIKYDDVGSIMQGFSSSVWIDGKRKDVRSPWTFTYGTQKGFFKWYSGQPSNGSTELCIRVHPYSVIQWRDHPCNIKFYSICEILDTS
jgi:hypothetical protein